MTENTTTPDDVTTEQEIDYPALLAQKDNEIRKLTATMVAATSQIGFKELIINALHITLHEHGVHVQSDGSIVIDAEVESERHDAAMRELRAQNEKLTNMVDALTVHLDRALAANAQASEAVVLDDAGHTKDGKPVLVASPAKRMSSGSMTTPKPSVALNAAEEEEYDDE